MRMKEGGTGGGGRTHLSVRLSRSVPVLLCPQSRLPSLYSKAAPVAPPRPSVRLSILVAVCPRGGGGGGHSLKGEAGNGGGGKRGEGST